VSLAGVFGSNTRAPAREGDIGNTSEHRHTSAVFPANRRKLRLHTGNT